MVKYVLSFYANVYTNVVTEPDEAHEEASKKLRDIGVKFEVFATNESYSSSEIPSNADLKEVSREFIDELVSCVVNDIATGNLIQFIQAQFLLVLVFAHFLITLNKFVLSFLFTRIIY